MNIIVLGAGKTGEKLVSNLVKEKHTITVIDEKAKSVENIIGKYDVMGVVGNGVRKSVLEEAGISHADFFIASTMRDEVNIICCSLAKKYGVKYTVARVRDPEYYTEIKSIREELFINMVFNPEYETANEISKILRFPSANNVESFADGVAAVAEFNITAESPLIGNAVVGAVKEFDTQIIYAMVKRGDKALIPLGDFVFESGDVITIIAKDKEIINFCKKMHIYKMPARSVVIIGGGKIAFYLAEKLIESGIDVKIIEQDENRSVELSNALTDATVLYGDGSDSDLLIEEKVDKADACVALTGIDEENAMIALYVKGLGVNKVVAKINRQSIINMVKALRLDSVVSPLELTVNKVIRFVRSRQNDFNGRVKKLYRLSETIEALEFKVVEGFPTGIPLKNMKIKKQVLIGGVVRGGEFILPTGDTTLELDDKIVVIAPARKINELSDVIR